MAPWWKRALAYIIDGVVVGVPMYFIFDVAVGVRGRPILVTGSNGHLHVTSSTQGGITQNAFLLISLVVALAYFSVLDGGRRGQTLGKLVMQIAVRHGSTGGPIGFRLGLIRRFVFEILFLAFVLPGVINVLSPLWDPYSQAWHDKVVGSLVVNVA